MCIKGLSGVFLFLVVVVFYPMQSAGAKNFTAHELLQWPKNKQNSYFQISISMAGAIAAQKESNIGTCINDWYFKDSDIQNQHIRNVMHKYPNFHPSGVILAILQKACGPIAE